MSVTSTNTLAGEAVTAFKIPADLYRVIEAEEQLCVHFGV